MSSTSSMPTLMRTSSGSTPAASSASVESWRCVVEPGWMTSVRVSPTLARCEHSSTRPMNASPASRPPSHAEREDRARALRQVLLGERVVRVVRQPGVADPAHARVGVEPLRDALRVGHVRLHPQRQRLHPLQDQERVERREHAAEVAQALDAQLGGEAVLAEVVPEAQVAVGRDRLGHHREVAVVPGEAAGVDDRAARSRCRDRRGTWSPSAGRCRRRSPAGGRGTATPASSRPRAARRRRARPSPAPRGPPPCRPGWRRSRCRRASCARAGPRRRRRPGRRARRTSSRCRAGAA